MADFRPRPGTRREFMDKLVTPYDEVTGNPNQIFSKTVLAGTPEFNRSLEISQKTGDVDVNVAIGLLDIDEAIQWHFDNVLKLSVTQNNQKKTVPVLYGSPERWKSIQADGYFRDVNNKIQVPLVIYRRTNVKPIRDLGNKLDGNAVKNLIYLQKGYNKNNVYNNFKLLNNRVRQKEYIVAFPPDYVEVTYECLIYTYYIEQMNKLVEAINFANNSYWGSTEKYQFRCSIEDFGTSVVIEVGDERMVKSSFNITTQGYTIPESINREVAVANRKFVPSQIAFGIEMAQTIGELNLERPNIINK